MGITIAIVGTGNVAQNNYLPFLSKEKDVSLVYFSRTPSKAERCADEFGGDVAGSIEELSLHSPDAFLVLTKETQRYQVVKAVLSLKPARLFFEKPLVAQNGQDKVCEDDFFKARELLQQCDSAGVETAMIFNYRFFALSERMRDIVTTRNFGQLSHASMFVNYACWSHCIDMLLSIGGRVSEVSGLSGRIRYRDAEDVSGSFILENGATGTILGTNGMSFDSPLYHIVFNFERGTIRFSDLDGVMEVLDPSNRYTESYGLIGNHSRWDQYRRSFEQSLEAYLKSIRNREAPPVPGSAGLEELQFEAALRRAIENRRAVDVQNELPLGA